MPFARIQSSAELSPTRQLCKSTVIKVGLGHERKGPQKVQLIHLIPLTQLSLWKLSQCCDM